MKNQLAKMRWIHQRLPQQIECGSQKIKRRPGRRAGQKWMSETMNQRTQQHIVDHQHGQQGQAKQPDQMPGLLLCVRFAIKKIHGCQAFLAQGRMTVNHFASHGNDIRETGTAPVVTAW
jgi:hypothetical protein